MPKYVCLNCTDHVTNLDNRGVEFSGTCSGCSERNVTFRRLRNCKAENIPEDYQ